MSQLNDLRAQFDACSEHARRLLTEQPAELVSRKPPSGGWSASDCVAHLAATNRHYYDMLRTALAAAPVGNGPFKMDFRGRLLKWILEPPYRSRVKTIPSMEPAAGQSPEQVLSEFAAGQQEIARILDLAEGKALEQVQITSPFSTRMRYNGYSCFAVLAAHERRHLWQAEQAL